MVEELHISSTPDANFSSYVESYRYPRAGSTNATSTLRIVEFCVKSSTNEVGVGFDNLGSFVF